MKSLPRFVAYLMLPVLLITSACTSQVPDEKIIRESITVKANINEVWNAWTTAEGIKTFFAPDAVVDAKPGGAFDIRMDPGAPAGMRGADGMVFLAVQEKKMISFTWNAPPSLPEARKQRTMVTVRFIPRGELLTEVALTHAGWGEAETNNEWGKAFDYFVKAWPAVLKNLKKRFESGPVDWKPWLERLEQQRKAAATR